MQRTSSVLFSCLLAAIGCKPAVGIPLWVVMRDTRGGVAFASAALTVVP